MNPANHALLAHQGGWDEVLLVVVPLAIIGALLWIANQRVKRQLPEEEAKDTKTGRAKAD